MRELAGEVAQRALEAGQRGPFAGPGGDALAEQRDDEREADSAPLKAPALELAADARRHQTVRSASVGDRRAARSAGSKPATAPIAIAAASPPAQAETGTTIAQCLVEA